MNSIQTIESKSKNVITNIIKLCKLIDMKSSSIAAAITVMPFDDIYMKRCLTPCTIYWTAIAAIKTANTLVIIIEPRLPSNR